MKSLIQTVEQFTGLSVNDILEISKKSQNTYKKYSIPKKRKGHRKISHPSKETKLLQYACVELLIDYIKPHPAAHGYIRGQKSPLLNNASKHAKQPFLLRVDFKDFFPSIRPADLFEILKVDKVINDIKLTENDQHFLENVFFLQNPDGSKGLPIGAPSSPWVSNIIMIDLDSQLSTLAEKNDFIYTRYADDLIFSTHEKKTCKLFLTKLKKILAKCKNPAVELNSEKTCFMSRNCRRAVTGLVISTEGKITIGRDKKRILRGLLNNFKYNRLDESKLSYLQGYLAFLLDVEPSYFNQLSLKYGPNLLASALKRRSYSTPTDRLRN